MRLRQTVLGGSAVILALFGWPQQAGGGDDPVASPTPTHAAATDRHVPWPAAVPGSGRFAPQDTTARDTVTASQQDTSAVQDTATATPQDTATAQDTTVARQDTVAVGDTVGATPQDSAAAPDTAIVTVQDTVAAPVDSSSAAQDSAAAAEAEAPSPDPGLLRLGLRTVRLPFTVDLLSGFRDPHLRRQQMGMRVRSVGEVWAEAVRREAEGRVNEAWRGSRPLAAQEPAPQEAEVTEPVAEAPVAEGPPVEAQQPQPGDTTPAQPPAPTEPAPLEADPTEAFAEVFNRYADLGLAIQGRVELGGGWNRFRPCNITFSLNCDPSLIPTLKPDIQFGARVGGTISDRIHVSVDYDNRREFDAANNINVFYQGLEDEILQRLEVGDVSFPLPQSRYLTQGIPAGNFGFRAAGQMGPIDFQTVFAQQKGDVGAQEFQLGGGGRGFEQTATTILDDGDYERGRFFFIFNPRRLQRYPHIDIQELIAVDAPIDVRPQSVVKVYRYETLGVGLGAQVPEGFITAIATAVDTIQTELGTDTVVTDTLTGLFRPLVDGEDYILHQSGIWIQLRNTVPDQEALAITYIATDGTERGTFNAEEVSDAHNADPDNVPPPRLHLIKGLNVRPGTATWAQEMHNVYRVSASPGVVESSVELIVSQGDPQVGNTFRTAPDGQQLEFLKIFGLDDDPTDNRLDLSQIYQVTSTSEEVPGPAGTFIVLPTLEPFRLPPPLQNVPGFSGQPFPLEPGDQNVTIYDDPNDAVRRGTNLYLLTINYRQRFEGFLSTISLGAGGVREGSERIIIDQQELVRGEDYIIDYDIGQVELREPERWFANNPSARLNVSFEQKPLFQLAPTSVFGFQARYGLGQYGEFNLIGLSQSEKTLQTRPELGLEPSAVQLGGISGRLAFEPQWLTNLMNALPGADRDVASTISFNGEMAVSMPTTNTQGITYLEDFEGGPGFTGALLARSWRLGSAPSTTAGAEEIAPLAFALENAAELVWQDQYIVAGPSGDPIIVGGLEPQQVDSFIRVQGQPRPEPVLTISERMPADRVYGPIANPVDGPAWASITQVISPSGQDFTTIEFLEFYVAVNDDLADSLNLIIDLGTVSEDAFAVDTLGFPSGIGELDREVDPPRVWSNAEDSGLWGTGCEAEPGRLTYNLADPDANCTRENGLEDTEDLNQNSILDSDERFFRYVVPIGDPNNRYFVRNANQLGANVRFKLFKIPLRSPDHRERVTDAEFQNIRHLRMTWVSQGENRVILARMRFLGSRWLKRNVTGVVQGLIDTTAVINPNSRAEVGPISTTDPMYVPPPGVTDQVANTTTQFEVGGTTFNEQSLSLRFTEIDPKGRAEVYLQFAQVPRDFLAYRSLLVWALGSEGPWGRAGQPLRFIVKLGENQANYYLYQTPLTEVPPGAGFNELRQAWLPEIDIDLNRMIVLRTRAEELMLRAGGLPGDSALILWDVDVFEDGDSSYAIVIGQRSRAPNLAAVRQISLGAYNSGDVPVTGTLWIDDMRLTRAVDNTGVVGQFDLAIRGTDLLNLRLSYASENPYFRQLAQDPSFTSASSFNVGGGLQLGRFAPESWGLAMPFNVNYNSRSSEPVLLPRTDVFVEQLNGLRTPDAKSLRLDLSLARRSRTPTPAVGWFVDNSSLRLSYDRRNSQTSRSKTRTRGLAASYTFASNIADVSFPLIPGTGLRLRLTPMSLQFSTAYSDTESETRRFEEIIELSQDQTAKPIRAFDERLVSSANMTFEPINSVTGRFNMTGTRDLVPTGLQVTGEAARDAIDQERSRLFGADFGWETARNIDMNWTWRPNVTNWLIPQATLDTRFRFNRGPSFIKEQAGDTVLTSDFSNSRAVRLSAGFNAPVMLRDIFGQPTGVTGALLGLLDWFDIFTATWAGTLSSMYQRQTAKPDPSYQLGFGDFNDFLTEDGDSASRVNDGEIYTLSSGLRLPLNTNITADFSQSDMFAWTPISQAKNRSITWPSLSFNWNRIPLPAFLETWVSSFGFRTGYTLRTTRNDVLDADQTRETETRSIPISVNLQLTTEWTFAYSLTMGDDKRRDPTGLTIGETTNQSLQLTGRVRPITRSGTFRNPVRISLRLSQNDQTQCRQLGAIFAAETPPDATAEELPGCEPFTDRRIREVDLTVGTDVTPFTLGLQGSWRDTQSGIGQRPGSTQLEISLFGQFLLETGEIR